MNSRVYDFLKGMALVWLPAAGTLYFALAGIWGLPYAEKIIGSIIAVDTFLGVILHLSAKGYTPPEPEMDGRVLVDRSKLASDNERYVFDLSTPLEDIPQKSEIRLKVVPAVPDLSASGGTPPS